MDWCIPSPQEWAQFHFGKSDLGDVRRTKRLVKVAANMANDPAGSIPQQSDTWADAKAVYRLWDEEDVTFEAVSECHWNLRHQCGPGTFLIISDTTEFDFGKHRRIDGVGPTGNGSGRGLFLHSGLMLDAKTKNLLCLAGAELLCRKPKRTGEKASARLKRKRESERWGDLIDRIGPAPAEATWVHVMDREADNYEVFYHCLEQRTGWVIRTRTMMRKILLDVQGSKPVALRNYLETLPLTRQFELQVLPKARTRREPARQGRTAIMEVRKGLVYLPPPRRRSSYLRGRQLVAIATRVIWVREVNPPAGEEAVEWVLYTSLPTNTWEEVETVINYYKARWIIEEWHKAIKTGTSIKARRLETGDRWAPLIALSSIEAVRLVQLKTMARAEPERPAEGVVPSLYLWMLRRALRIAESKKLTIREFFRGVARLGGFLARKGDGEPGWQTTWRGWEKLMLMIRGYSLASSRQNPKKCG
jgi:transposase-like protein/transposase Tn5 family protein/DDE family transposase